MFFPELPDADEKPDFEITILAAFSPTVLFPSSV
jgi:hypothetical protein